MMAIAPKPKLARYTVLKACAYAVGRAPATAAWTASEKLDKSPAVRAVRRLEAWLSGSPAFSAAGITLLGMVSVSRLLNI